MSGNSWGLFGTGLALWLAMIGLPPQYLWLQPWFLFGGGVSFVASAICFSWPLLRRVLISLLDKRKGESEPKGEAAKKRGRPKKSA